MLQPHRCDFIRLQCLYVGHVDLTSIAFGAHTSDLPISLQSYSALMLRPHLFDFNRLRLRRLYFVTRLEAGWIRSFIGAALSHYRRVHVARKERSVGTGLRS
jgi:hypothetical protein